MRLSRALAAAGAALVLASTPARAEERPAVTPPGITPARVTEATTAAAVGPAVFALIVTSNRSNQLDRPDLQYADDDGAKYLELFSMLAPAEHVVLLTELDDDSRRLFPAIGGLARPPTGAGLRAAARELAGRVERVRAAGREVDFYFVFAGHGDVDRGRGFLELGDEPLTANQLEVEILGAVQATRTHVILDSCNSFFVINPRKPGGRRFATPKDVGRGLADQLADTGVFLSTSAEAEVFEWSELQAGVFSHAVRSGLAGAADADDDGRVSYRELEAFVAVSASQIRNPLYRPHVFARGPGGADDRPLIDLRGARAAVLELDQAEAVRFTIRDGDELRWLDGHKEAGRRLRLRLPVRLASRLSLEELDPTTGVRRRWFERVGPWGPGALLASSLAPSERASGGARGGRDLFRSLFARPFGPLALAAYEASRPGEPEPVFGLSRAEVSRMRLLLDHTAGVDHQQKFVTSFGAAVAGGAVALTGVYFLHHALDRGASPDLFETDRRTGETIGWAFITSGSLTLGLSLYRMTTLSRGEQVYREFERELQASPRDPAAAAASTERRLIELGEADRTWRRVGELALWATTGLCAAGLAYAASGGGGEWQDELGLFAGGCAVTAGFGALAVRRNPTPIERMVDLWQGEPATRSAPHVAIQPRPGGALAEVGWRF